jgi:hypothetical protein
VAEWQAKVWGRRDRWKVAAYYPVDGYGGASEYDTASEAMWARDRMLANGFLNVHVTHVVEEPVQDTMTVRRRGEAKTDG